MIVEGRRSAPLETGGVLTGYWAETGDEAIVTEVVGPGPRAVHERSRFRPDTEYHEAEVARIYLASGRVHTYLGDWHTHPDGGSYLSAADLATLRRISHSHEARAPNALMLVLGNRGDEWTVGGWAAPLNGVFPWRRSRPRIVRIRLTHGIR